MNSAPHPARSRKSGIVLISTLLSLMLIVGAVMVLQARAVSSAVVVKRLSGELRTALVEDSARELVRPMLVAVIDASTYDSAKNTERVSVAELDKCFTVRKHNPRAFGMMVSTCIY